MKSTPQVVVLSPYQGEAAAAELVRSLAGQTWKNPRLLLVTDGAAVVDVPASAEITSPSELGPRLADPTVDHVFFWPANMPLLPAAIEKLVLALHLAPDQFAVSDRSRGQLAPWLARPKAELLPLARAWMADAEAWTDLLDRSGAPCFHLDECLTLVEQPAAAAQPDADEDPASTPLAPPADTPFPYLPLQFRNFEPVPEEPLWPLSAAETAPDPDSIMILITSLPIGGACKFILDLTAELRARGKRVMVATTIYCPGDPHPWLREFLRQTDDVFILSHARRVELPRLAVHLARTRRCGRVLLTHTMLGYLLLPWLRAQLPDVTFVDYTHIEYEAEWPIGGYALRSAHAQSMLDLSLASSEHLRGWMVRHGSKPDRVRVCHTNIDTERWKLDDSVRREERARLGIDPASAMILYPCRIVEQKRPELLCNIVAALRAATSEPFVVVIAGSGHLLPALVAFIRQHRLEPHVRILGPVDLARVARLHAAADIFLLPSFIEGIALALFEAMALESVPVAADVGGQRELVTPECGHLIPLGEPAAEAAQYVAALKSLLENPDLRRKMAQAARRRVCEHFPLRRMVDTFLAAMWEGDANRRRRPVPLPAQPWLRETATLAMDHLRLEQQGALAFDTAVKLRQVVAVRDKTIEKLQRQVRELMAARGPRPDALPADEPELALVAGD